MTSGAACSALNSPWRWWGSEDDAATGSGQGGQFSSPDPARDQHFEDTQSWNIYSYVRNSPISRVDPTGLEQLLIYEAQNGADGNETAEYDILNQASESIKTSDDEKSKIPVSWSTDKDLVNAIRWMAGVSSEIGNLLKESGVTADMFVTSEAIPGEGRTRYEPLPLNQGEGLEAKEFLINPNKIQSLEKLAEKVGHELRHAKQAKDTQNGGKTDALGGKIDLAAFRRQMEREKILMERIKFGDKASFKEYEKLGIETKARESGDLARLQVTTWLRENK